MDALLLDIDACNAMHRRVIVASLADTGAGAYKSAVVGGQFLLRLAGTLLFCMPFFHKNMTCMSANSKPSLHVHGCIADNVMVISLSVASIRVPLKLIASANSFP